MCENKLKNLGHGIELTSICRFRHCFLVIFFLGKYVVQHKNDKVQTIFSLENKQDALQYQKILKFGNFDPDDRRPK